MSYRQTAINVDEYRVLYDQPEYPASNASCAWQHGRHWMTLQEATDGEFGFVMQLTKSRDMGRTWSVPVPFGPPITDARNEFQSAHLMRVYSMTITTTR